MATLDGDLIQLVLLLAQGLWGVVFWQFSSMIARLDRIEQAMQKNHLALVGEYTLKTEHDKLRERVHHLVGHVQTLKAYEALRPHLGDEADHD